MYIITINILWLAHLSFPFYTERGPGDSDRGHGQLSLKSPWLQVYIYTSSVGTECIIVYTCSMLYTRAYHHLLIYSVSLINFFAHSFLLQILRAILILSDLFSLQYIMS